MRYSIAFVAAMAATVECHGLITSITGANGVTMPGLSVADGTPRDCASPGCGSEADTSIIRAADVASGKASPLGRTKAGGPVDAGAAIAKFMGTGGAAGATGATGATGANPATGATPAAGGNKPATSATGQKGAGQKGAGQKGTPATGAAGGNQPATSATAGTKGTTPATGATGATGNKPATSATAGTQGTTPATGATGATGNKPAGGALGGALGNVLSGLTNRGLLDALTGGGANAASGTTSKGTKTPKGTTEGGVAAAAGSGAASGLPTTANDGTITMTFHQINQDGAGPLTAAIDPTSGGTDAKAFQTAQVTMNVPGIGIGGLSAATTTDFPVKVQMPAGMTCTGTAGGVQNVCIVKMQNSALAGPFGGSAAFTQSAQAKKRAVEYNLRKRHFARGLFGKLE